MTSLTGAEFGERTNIQLKSICKVISKIEWGNLHEIGFPATTKSGPTPAHLLFAFKEGHQRVQLKGIPFFYNPVQRKPTRKGGRNQNVILAHASWRRGNALPAAKLCSHFGREPASPGSTSRDSRAGGALEDMGMNESMFPPQKKGKQIANEQINTLISSSINLTIDQFIE